MHNSVDPVPGFSKGIGIADVTAHKAERIMRCQSGEPGFLEAHIVVVIEIVDPDNRFAPRHQGKADIHADKTGSSCHKYGHGARSQIKIGRYLDIGEHSTKCT
jgi:hypothetical protein